jgi:integrative and conjugative element protein (TIGR02256 family)
VTLVWLERRARQTIRHEALQRRFLETGGALFGYEAAGEVVVACAFGPGDHARHRPRSFEPDRARTAALIASVRKASEQRYRFLGSWHTHPRGIAIPSATDTRTAAAMSAQADLILPRPLLLIQATRGYRATVKPDELVAWRWDDDANELQRTPIETADLEERYCPP